MKVYIVLSYVSNKSEPSSKDDTQIDYVFTTEEKARQWIEKATLRPAPSSRDQLNSEDVWYYEEHELVDSAADAHEANARNHAELERIQRHYKSLPNDFSKCWCIRLGWSKCPIHNPKAFVP